MPGVAAAWQQASSSDLLLEPFGYVCEGDHKNKAVGDTLFGFLRPLISCSLG